MNKIEMSSLPIVGKKYHFFDDGKVSDSRYYIAECLEVIPSSESDNVIFNLTDYGHFIDYADTDNPVKIDTNLTFIWNYHTREKNYLFSDKTDYFVRCHVKEFDNDDLWFARTLDGGWFSMDIQNTWQGGRLDIDDVIYNRITKEYGEKFYTRK